MGASSDVGDVSWLVPEIRLGVTTAPVGTPWHSWAVVACGGMSIGHKGLVHAAKALAMTMVDLYSNPQLVEDIRSEFDQRMEGKTYEAILPTGHPRYQLPKINRVSKCSSLVSGIEVHNYFFLTETDFYSLSTVLC